MISFNLTYLTDLLFKILELFNSLRIYLKTAAVLHSVSAKYKKQIELDSTHLSACT